MISLGYRKWNWATKKFQEQADQAWDAVAEHIDPNGRALGASAETPPGDGFGLPAALERTFAERFDHAGPSAAGGAV